MTKGRRKIRQGMAGAVLLSVAVAVAGLMMLSQSISEMRLSDRDKPLWIANQMQFEMLRFDAAAQDYALGRETYEGLTQRLNILWSRLSTFEEGYVADVLESRGIDLSVIRDIRNWLETLDETVFAQDVPPATAESRREMAAILRDRMSSFKTDLQKLSLSVVKSETQEQTQFKDALLTLSNRVTLLGVVAMAALGLFGLFLWIDGARSRKLAEKMEVLANHAGASLRAKDSFVTVVSHELRTPLTSIYGSIELIKAAKNSDLSPTNEKLISIAHRNCERLITLVNDILDIDKLDANLVILDNKCFNLSQTVRDAVRDNENYATGLQVGLSLRVIDTELYVEGDEVRIAQVLSNLISNASKFSPAGSTVEVIAYQNGPRARVEVRDEGQGIPEEEHERIFERFHQGSQVTSTTYKGTGLGLSIAKAIVEQHNGRIDLKSTPGKGTTFFFELPIKDESKDTSHRPASCDVRDVA